MFRAFRIAYDGRPYRGFQRQPDQVTVEGAILNAFEELDIDAVNADYAAAGRTDAGVSAVAQTIAVRCPEWLDAAALNGALPNTICAWAQADVPADFHPQYDPTERAYTYLIDAPEVAWSRLKRGCDLLEGTHNVRHLTADSGETTREVSTVRVERADPFARLTVRAPGFLRHQVRRMVTVLTELGRGDRTFDELESILAGRELAGHRGIAPAPPEPLVLTEVVYPNTSFDAHLVASDRVYDTFRTRQREANQVAATMGTIADHLA